MYVDHYGIIIFGKKKAFSILLLPGCFFFFYRSNMPLLLRAESTMSLMNKSSVYKFLTI